jgi:hypothetical protein
MNDDGVASESPAAHVPLATAFSWEYDHVFDGTKGKREKARG